MSKIRIGDDGVPDTSGIDPNTAAGAARGAGDMAAHVLLAGGAAVAGLLRLASYSGPRGHGALSHWML